MLMVDRGLFRRPINIKTKRTIEATLSYLKYLLNTLFGKKADNILEPSSGGIGIKLNTAKPIFIIIKKLKKVSVTYKKL